MENIITMFFIFIAIILAVICLIGIYAGIDLKKGSDWVYVLCGFLAGALVGLSNGDFHAAVGIGIVGSIIVAYSGEMIRRQRALFAPTSKPVRKKRKTHK